MTRVQRIDADDWAAWRAMRQRALSEDPQSFASSTAMWTGDDDVEHRWRGRIAGAHSCFLAHRVGEPVAMVAVDEDDATGELVLASMWVRPEVRREGVGRALVLAVLEAAGGRPVRLRVIDGNAAAAATYAEAGFELQDAPPDAEGCRTMRRPGEADVRS